MLDTVFLGFDARHTPVFGDLEFLVFQKRQPKLFPRRSDLLFLLGDTPLVFLAPENGLFGIRPVIDAALDRGRCGMCLFPLQFIFEVLQQADQVFKLPQFFGEHAAFLIDFPVVQAHQRFEIAGHLTLARPGLAGVLSLSGGIAGHAENFIELLIAVFERCVLADALRQVFLKLRIIADRFVDGGV